jgi:hypothetical protein
MSNADRPVVGVPRKLNNPLSLLPHLSAQKCPLSVLEASLLLQVSAFVKLS